MKIVLGDEQIPSRALKIGLLDVCQRWISAEGEQRESFIFVFLFLFNFYTNFIFWKKVLTQLFGQNFRESVGLPEPKNFFSRSRLGCFTSNFKLMVGKRKDIHLVVLNEKKTTTKKLFNSDHPFKSYSRFSDGFWPPLWRKKIGVFYRTHWPKSV